MATKKVERFPLLIYRLLSRHWYGPALWLIPAGVLLWWIVPYMPGIDTQYAPLTLILSVVGGLIAGYALLARRARISLHSDHFTLHTPFYPIACSYRRISQVRPVDFKSLFPLEKEKVARRDLYKKLWGKTAIVVDLRAYPLPLWWLKLWLPPYMFHPTEIAWVFSVDDWMKLSRALEEARRAQRDYRRPAA